MRWKNEIRDPNAAMILINRFAFTKHLLLPFCTLRVKLIVIYGFRCIKKRLCSVSAPSSSCLFITSSFTALRWPNWRFWLWRSFRVFLFSFFVYLFCAIKTNDRLALLIDRYCYVRCKCEIIRSFETVNWCGIFFFSISLATALFVL